MRFAHPQEVFGLLGNGTEISDLYLQVRVGGDVALLKGIMKEVLAAEARSPGRVLDWAFIRNHTEGFERFLAALDAVSFDDLVRESGIARKQMREAAAIYVDADRVIACWAMGLTQHKHGVANVQEIANLLFLRGNIGKPGAGVCPVRGHSNVQGDRTMGIWEQPKPEFLSRLSAEFRFEPPSGARIRHRQRDSRHARGAGQGLRRDGGQLPDGEPRHGVHGVGAPPLPSDGRGGDDAQPHAPDHRRRG